MVTPARLFFAAGYNSAVTDSTSLTLIVSFSVSAMLYSQSKLTEMILHLSGRQWLKNRIRLRHLGVSAVSFSPSFTAEAQRALRSRRDKLTLRHHPKRFHVCAFVAGSAIYSPE